MRGENLVLRRYQVRGVTHVFKALKPAQVTAQMIADATRQEQTVIDLWTKRAVAVYSARWGWMWRFDG